MSARRPWAWPLVPLYAAVTAAKDALRGRPKRLRWPVVSVGSISAGGAGKTPVVIALARMLQGRGWDVDVLSRGYVRTGHGVEWVASQGDGAAARFGDEPVMIARATAAAVWVGSDRYAAGLAAEGGSGGGAKEKQILLHPSEPARRGPRCGNDRQKDEDFPQHTQRDDAEDGAAEPGVAEWIGCRRVHLLDDGFQHRPLARNFDVVLLTAEDLDDALMPAGNRREGFDALQRADALVVREDELEDVKKRVWALMREGAQMWIVRRRLEFPAPLFVFGAGLRPVAFCAIARPEGFQSMLMDAGCGVVETIAFDDHHAYGMPDMERILEVARRLNATGFVTTEKDNVKLTKPMCERLETLGPVMVVRLVAEFADADAVVSALESRLGTPA